jgi:hypothetical protein
MRKLRAYESQGMFAVIHFIIFCLSICYLKIQRFKYTKLGHCLYFCMGTKLDLTLRKERRLKVSENSVLRELFGPKREEVRGCSRRVELYNLHSSPDTIGMIE